MRVSPVLLALVLSSPSLAADDREVTGSEMEIDLEGLGSLSLEDLFNVDVVTATKTARSADEVPAMIEVVTAQQIRDRGYRHLADVLNDLPDNHEDRTNWGIGEPLSQNVGFGFRFDTGQNMLLLFNGQRLNAFLPGNRFGMEEYLLDNVDRIEIIRGPGSALYGANAFTSVINIISKSRMEEDEQPYVRAAIGGWPTSGGAYAEASWKTSVGRGFLSGAIRGGTEQGQELFIENGLFGDQGVEDAVRHTIDGDVFFSLDDFRLYGKVNHQLRNTVTGFNGVQPSDNDALSLLGYAYSLGADYTQEASPKVQVKYSLGAHLDNWTEVGLIPMFVLNEAGDGLARDENGNTILDDSITVERDGEEISTGGFLIDGQGADTFTGDAEVQVNVQYYESNSIVFGINGTYDRIVNAYRDTEIQLVPFGFVPLQRLTDPENNWLFDISAARLTGGAYAQIDYALARQLFTYAGARYDVYAGTGELAETYTAFNPRAGVVWKNRSVGNVKALFGQATRIPNGFEALSSVTILGSPENRPEQIYTFQGAWERTFADVLSLQGGYFYSVLNNHLITDANITDQQAALGYIGRFVNVSGERSHSQGIDGKLTIRTGTFSLNANATRFLGTDNGSGEPLAYIPQTMVNLNVAGMLWWLTPNLGVNYRGDFSKTADDPRPEVPDYVLVNPTLAFRPPTVPLEIRGGARNLLDLDIRFPSSSRDFTSHFPARGLELWAEASYKLKF